MIQSLHNFVFATISQVSEHVQNYKRIALLVFIWQQHYLFHELSCRAWFTGKPVQRVNNAEVWCFRSYNTPQTVESTWFSCDVTVTLSIRFVFGMHLFSIILRKYFGYTGSLRNGLMTQNAEWMFMLHFLTKSLLFSSPVALVWISVRQANNLFFL